jgi:type II secretory pathway pseudopilin PulG
MARSERCSGFTIAEALIALVVVALLSAVFYPVMAAARQRAKVGAAVNNLRTIHLGMELYRNLWDGSDVYTSYRSYYAIGLPIASESPGYAELPGITSEVWRSPCASEPADWTICSTTRFPGYCLQGYVSYVAGYYRPDILEFPDPGNANRHDYLNYLQTYQGNSVLVVDVLCNPPGTNMRTQFLHKRGLALLINGTLVNRIAEGNAGDIRWYSDPE